MANDQHKKKTWTAQPFPRGSIVRSPDESDKEFRRRYDRERYKALKSADPEFLRKQALKAAKFRTGNPEKAAAWRDAAEAKKPDYYKLLQRRYYESHSEIIKTRVAAWLKANPGKVVQYRYARRRQKALGLFTKDDCEEIFAAQRGKCAMCRADLRKVRPHLDHIMPLAKGGANERRNLQWLCQPCNNRKSAKRPEAFARELGLLL